MDVFLYNTLSRSREKFVPLMNGEAGVYACGPTVYDYAHIGNMRTYIFEDVLVRTLKCAGYRTTHVMNVTDVGHLVSDADDGADKMELGAERESKSAWEIAGFYTQAFFRDFKALNCLMPDKVCAATEHIGEMIALIKRLDEKGLAYKISDGIYFDVSKFPSYGKLAGKSHMDGIKAGARVEFSREKKNAADFALWKFSPAGRKRQMEWTSPWGTGFPGWHIECSAMSMKYLGETFDIHCGGADHIAVHHTNEIAQAEAATGKNFVNYWLHGEFLVMGGSDKMAKSAGNFITVGELQNRGYSPLDYRYLCFSAHYRKQLEFTWDNLATAARSLAGLRESVWSLRDELESSGARPVFSAEAGYYGKFTAAACDDLNMPQALAVLWEVIRDRTLSAAEKIGFVEASDGIFGLDLPALRPAAEELAGELSALVKSREEARKNRDFAKADEIRKTLLERGVVLEDTPSGPRWKKK